MTAHERLETSYRRLLRCFPARYRAEREAEMLGVLLDLARPGQRRPDPADAGDLVVAAGRAWAYWCWAGLRPRLSTLAVVTLLLLPLGIALLPGHPATGTPLGQAATLPSRFAGYSSATGSVSDAPAGRAVALYQQGLEPTQDVVLAADRDAYRRLDLAESHRAGDDPAGMPAPAELSPDGAQVVVGYLHTKSAQLSVQDLVAGGVANYSLPAPPAGDGPGAGDTWGVGAIPLAWSGDGARIAYAGVPAPGPAAAPSGPVDVGVLDTRTGRVVVVARAPGVAAVAFGPTGTEVAVQEQAGGPIRVTGLDATVRRVLAVPAGMTLAGPAAWSPDGRWMAVSRMRAGCPDRHDVAAMPGWCAADRTAFIDSAGSGPALAPLVTGPELRHQFVGWRAADRIVVAQESARDGVELLDVRLGVTTTGAIRQLSAIADRGGYPVGTVQLATGLLGDLRVRVSSTPDRGRWPTTWRLAAAAAATALLWPTIVIPARLRRRRVRVAPVGRADPDAVGRHPTG